MTDLLRLKSKTIRQRFPFSYTDELVFYTPETFDEVLFFNKLNQSLFIKESEPNIIAQAPISFSKLPIEVGIKIHTDRVTTQLIFIVSLLENNMVLLLFFSASIFLFHFDDTGLAMLALVAGLVFYGLNLHKTISSLKRIAIDAAGATLDLGEPALWKKQKKWLNDSRVCPACGEPKNTYSYKCINCGIYFTKPGKQKPTEVVSSSIKGITIHYQLSKKNAKDCC